MGYHYAILGAGRQGIAAAYDLARFGDAGEIRLFDLSWGAASRGADKINRLVNREVVQGYQLDVCDPKALYKALAGRHAAISAVPYLYNLTITETAIETRTHLCDLGGHTSTVREQLALAETGRDQGVSIIPDCGMGPGINISLGMHALSFVEHRVHSFECRYRYIFRYCSLLDLRLCCCNTVAYIPGLASRRSRRYSSVVRAMACSVGKGGLQRMPRRLGAACTLAGARSRATARSR